MRIRVCGDVLQPLVLYGIDDAKDRSVRHIPGRQVVAVIARIEPDLINASHLVNGGNDFPRSAVNHVLVGRKGNAVMVGASHQEIVAGSLDNAGRKAVRRRESIDDYRTVWISQPGIN